MRRFIQPKFIRIVLPILAFCSILLDQFYLNLSSRLLRISNDEVAVTRRLIKMLPDGDCEWVEPKDVSQDPEFNLFSTLLVSYPGSAKRAAHMQISGLTERTTRDDFFLDRDAPVQRYAFYKTQYPHHEGIWSWRDAASQSIYVLQNPRMALLTYHFVLVEIYFSTTWIKSYDALDRVFTIHGPVDGWQRWRDTRFRSEIHQWSWHLDFWVEGGLMRDFYTHEITTPEHFERLKHPENFGEGELKEYQAALTDVQPTYDEHCTSGEIQAGCSPVAITSFEGIMSNATGPLESAKLASAIENKAGFEVIEQNGRECAWRKVVVERVTGVRDDRDRQGPPIESYVFTKEEMQMIIEELERVRTKYSSAEWNNNEIAQQIVEYMEGYIVDNQAILDAM